MDALASRVTEKKSFKNGRIFIVPTGAKDVVTVEGSILGGYHFLPPSQRVVPIFASQLFDAGTKAHTKDALRDSLAARGVHISFSAGGDRVYFSGSCLPEDLPFLLNTVTECLSTAVFTPKEIATVRTELLGRLKESKTDTGTQASQEIMRLMYDSKHVNYPEKDSDTEKLIKAVTRKELLTFQKTLGRDNLVLGIAGDVNVVKALAAAEKAFGKLPAGYSELVPKARNKKAAAATEKRLFIPHKTSIDLYLGAAVPITYMDPLYTPFRVMLEMLGSGFTGHLMQTVRERDGLTYRTFATSTGFQKDAEGAFEAYASFAPEIFEKGLKTMHVELGNFFSTGLKEDALEKKKEGLIGKYAVSLSTTFGIASLLHMIGERGYDLSYMDDYIKKVKAVTLDDLKAAAALIPLDKLSVSAAGTFAK